MIIIVGNGIGNPSSNPVCILLSANTLEEGMHPTILLPAMGK